MITPTSQLIPKVQTMHLKKWQAADINDTQCENIMPMFTV